MRKCLRSGYCCSIPGNANSLELETMSRRDSYDMDKLLEKIATKRDIGVIIDKLDFSEHLAEKINKVSRIVGLIQRTFITMDEGIFRCLWVALVRAWGDTIVIYKILSGMYDDVCWDIFVLQEDQQTRGHSKNIFKKR